MRRFAALLFLLFCGGVGPASGAAHTARDVQTELNRLASLRTATPLSSNGFGQWRFPHWRDPDRNGCNARQDALIRGGTQIKRGPHCAIRSGRWFDPYSGKIYRNPRSVDADHLVPLANAWSSGARRWTRTRRAQFANDPIALVVTSTVLDRQKGDRSPDRWKPPRRAYWYTYAQRWIRIKTRYHLAVTPSERAALQMMLQSAPANSVLPVISGTPRVASTLTATDGSWSGSPAPTFTRRWQRCAAAGCADIAGANGSGYSPVAADAGQMLRVVVTATNSAGSATATSAQGGPIDAAPANSASPMISGSTKVGSTLSATDGTWSGWPAPTFSRRWQRCAATTCVDIAGATGPSYLLVGADAGKKVQVVVTATNSAGSGTSTSAQVGTITSPPVNSVLPVISGTTKVGSRLTTTNGTWSSSSAPTFTRRWQRCAATSCVDIGGATGSSYLLVSADAGQKLQVVVTATNSAGSVSATSLQTATITVPTTTGDPTIAAAGDIACDPLSSNFNGGAGTGAECAQLSVSNLIFGKGFSAVLPLGDNQYYCGGLSDYQLSYDLSWGRLLSVTRPVVGNHEYVTSGGTGCDTTGNASGYFTYFGSRAGSSGQGYYSYDVGSWHLIALNSNCGNVGGCTPVTPQGQWLAADLAAHRNACILAYWHIPLFSSGGRAASNAQSLWTALYNAGADVILNGHDHIYERFAPQTPAGVRDDAGGMREFIVGTGGANHTSLVTLAANSEVQNTTTFGILKLTLHANSYDWQFVPAAGTGSFTDSGSQACH